MTAVPGRVRQRCCLYRHYDEVGTLLYVGISTDPGLRSFSHATTSRWVRFAVRMDGHWYNSTTRAREAEEAAIRDEEPVFNLSCRGRRDDAEARMTEYELTHSPLFELASERRTPLKPESIARDLRERIELGQLEPGEEMNVSSIAREWGVGFETATTAVKHLLREGLVERPRATRPCIVARKLPTATR